MLTLSLDNNARTPCIEGKIWILMQSLLLYFRCRTKLPLGKAKWAWLCIGSRANFEWCELSGVCRSERQQYVSVYILFFHTSIILYALQLWFWHNVGNYFNKMSYSRKLRINFVVFSGKRIDALLDTNSMSTVEATLYRSYKVIWLLKFGKCEACLGEYGNIVFFTFRQKWFSCNIFNYLKLAYINIIRCCRYCT